MNLFVLGLLGCWLVDSVENKVTDAVDQQGLEALDGAKTVVQAAEASPGKRRVLRLISRLERDIESGERTGLNGNVVAELVKRIANDGTISGIEAGAVEDAYRAIVDDTLGTREGGRRGRQGAEEPAPEEPATEPPPEDPMTEN